MKRVHDAAAGGSERCVQLLLKKGADMSLQDQDGETALHHAARTGRQEVMGPLLEEEQDDEFNATLCQNLDGETPLHCAAAAATVGKMSNGDVVGVLALLIVHGAEVNDRDHNGTTALHHAASAGITEAVRLLLDNGADVTTSTCDVFPPLHRAAANGHYGVVQLLVDRGVDVKEQEAEDFYPPIMRAASAGHENVVRVLLENGANVEAWSDIDF